jgi:hypothetical protein
MHERVIYPGRTGNSVSCFRKAALTGAVLAILLSTPIQVAFGASSSLTFGSTINLSSDKGPSTISDVHSVAASGSNVYVTWGGPVHGAQSILFRASNDNGASWGPVIDLSNDAGPNVLQKLAAFGSSVYVVWLDRASGTALVYLRESNDGGATFGPSVQISQYAAIEPKVATCGTSVYVAWINSSARAQGNNKANETNFFRASQNQGSTWGPVINLQADDSVAARGNEEEVECYGHNVYVVYSDYALGYREVFIRASHNNGLTFLPHFDLSQIGGKGNIREPVVAVGGSYVYGYWIYRTSGSSNYQTFVRVSSDNGTTWGAKVNVCVDSYDCHEPFMAASGSNGYIVLHEFTHLNGVTKLYYRVTHDGGMTWGPKIDLTGLSEKYGNTFGSISASGSWLFITWADIQSGNWEMYFVSSNDYGNTLSSPQNLSNNAGASGVQNYGHLERAMTSSANFVYVIWEDNTTFNGNIDLFFRAAPFS